MANHVSDLRRLLQAAVLRPELVRDLITDFVPEDWLRRLDYDTLEKVPTHYLGDNLRQRLGHTHGHCRHGRPGTAVGGKYQPRLAYLLIDMSQYQDNDWKALNNRFAMAVRFEKADLADLPGLVHRLNEMLDGNIELHRIFSIWMRELLYRRSSGTLLLPEVVNLAEVKMSLVGADLTACIPDRLTPKA